MLVSSRSSTDPTTQPPARARTPKRGTTLVLSALSLVLSSAAVAATPPLLAEIPAQSAPLNQIYSFNLTPYVRVTDGDTITFLVNDLPAGLNANKNTGLISGTPSATGSYTVGVRARDKDGDSPKQKFIIKVGTPPVLDSIPDQDGRKNITFSFSLVPYASATDGDTILYFANGLPEGLSVDKRDGLISGAPSVTGRFNIAIRARDADGTSTKRNFILRITQPLNDTGVLRCGTPYGSATPSNDLKCSDPAAVYPQEQDAQHGRDYLARTGQLIKVGGSTPNKNKTNGFDYTKIGSNGQPLAIQDAVWNPNGDETQGTQWDCVLDNLTGLLWENKSDDGRLRDKEWTYTWYNSDSTKNGGSMGTPDGGTCFKNGRCDTEKYVKDVNAVGLCGYKDWRMPTVSELGGILDYGKLDGAQIDSGYFPTLGSRKYFWSASPRADRADQAEIIMFDLAYVGIWGKGSANAVRLVRGR